VALAALVVGLMALPVRGRAQDAVGACGDQTARYAQVQVDGSPRIDLELARTSQERERGLMDRPYLPPDSGMLFVYQFQAQEAYWMLNTLIPLSIAFIDRDGTIVDIQDMARLNDPTDSLEATQHEYPSAAPYWYALEVNQGWFVQHGVGTGQQILFCLG
jgi:uncharacterized membrane protein (UPF0127 family)